MHTATLSPQSGSDTSEEVRYIALVEIGIEKFVPMTGVYGESPSIVATISPPKDISPPPQPSTPVFSGNGEFIKVTVPKDYTGAVQIVYQLQDPRYVLLGAAFKSPTGGVGETEFREILLERDPASSQMTVTDACLPSWDKVNFSYVILVQEASTGNIGLIDPGIETDTNEN
jgi:hypothetical protein